jgi:segregation and condensation protein A
MDAAKIFEGIALLIDLAQRGEIDPWDVQVIEVIDRYLSKIITAEVTPGAYEADLSQSGQAFLSASMLVLFKANTLIELESPDTELDSSEDDFLLESEDGVGTRLRLPLEQQLSRRPAALPPQKRRVTLKELIDQLQLIATQLQLSEEAMALSGKTPPTRRLDSRSRAQAARATLELAHQENLTEVAGELEQFFNRHSHHILAQEQDWLNLDQLVELWTYTKQAAAMPSSIQHRNQIDGQEHPELSSPQLPAQRHERVSVFWALLLLSAQSKVELSQEEFYQDIKIRALLNSALSEG